MRRLLIGVWVAMGVVAYGAHAGAADGAAADPRATVLVLGDQNAMPAGAAVGWPQMVQKAHPEWNVVTSADAARPLGALLAEVDKILEPLPHVEVVVIFSGTADAAAESYGKTDAAALAGQMSKLVQALQANGKTAKAAIALATPMPVVEARLDQWSKERFKGSEGNMKAIAEAYRGVAAERKIPLIDFYAWAWADADGGKPARLVGTIGWTMRDWGVPIAARYFGEQIAALKPTPPDAAAFAAWQKERAAETELETLLAATSEGIVAHAAPLAAAAGAGKQDTSIITVPPEALTGESLNLVLFPSDKQESAIGTGANLPGFRPKLAVTVTGEAKPVEIFFPSGDWQLIDEAQGETPVDGNAYRFNSGKMNTYGFTSNEPGKRRWMLVRVPLAKIAGKKVEKAELTVAHPAALERFTPPQTTANIDMKNAGHCTAAVVIGNDVKWDDALATWKTRDGKVGWSGGEVKASGRVSALESFLKTDPPKAVAEKARAMLDSLKPVEKK